MEQKGSCSRARAHQRQEFWGQPLNSMLASAFPEADGRFSVADLFVQPQHGLPDHLVGIPSEDRVDFLCGILYTALIDQVVYAHRRADYCEFRALTRYPKMDRTVGWARTMMMANPYEVFGREVLEPRKITDQQVLLRFEAWASFIVADLRKFFSEHSVGTTTWDDIRKAMLSDPDCTWGILGATLRRSLESKQASLP